MNQGISGPMLLAERVIKGARMAAPLVLSPRRNKGSLENLFGPVNTRCEDLRDMPMMAGARISVAMCMRNFLASDDGQKFRQTNGFRQQIESVISVMVEKLRGASAAGNTEAREFVENYDREQVLDAAG